ncbi:hypothetical protein Q7C36_007786 [Tachysurus vachellii]|uniref:Uncharacterized protein n=1 Tax=Tachysurus vachellii TaxID=175792 RepID=A0AA88SXM8_TACVA|nr:hypothetical protein Q7C36_007786 [Tachysurus vachellii]
MALRKAAVFMALPADKGVSAWSFSTVSIFNIMLLPLNELSVTYCEHQDEIRLVSDHVLEVQLSSSQLWICGSLEKATHAEMCTFHNSRSNFPSISILCENPDQPLQSHVTSET